MGWLHAYWGWAGSNIGAMPAEFVVTVAAGLLFRKAIRRAIDWLRRDAHLAMARAQEDVAMTMAKAQADAEAAREIAADLFRHLTGDDHPVQVRK